MPRRADRVERVLQRQAHLGVLSMTRHPRSVAMVVQRRIVGSATSARIARCQAGLASSRFDRTRQRRWRDSMAVFDGSMH
jgi:hypothetical protein